MPVTRQTIAIIESRSTIGAAIARGVSTGNYRILLVNPDKKNERLVDELRSTHPEADVEMLDCSHTGCWEADTIVVSVPADEWEGISQKIEEVSTQKVVLGTVNNAERSEEHTSELQSRGHLVCRLLLEKKKNTR